MPEHCLGSFYAKVFSNVGRRGVTELMRMPTMVSSPVFEFQFLSFLEYVFWRWKGQVTGARNRMTIGNLRSYRSPGFRRGLCFRFVPDRLPQDSGVARATRSFSDVPHPHLGRKDKRVRAQRFEKLPQNFFRFRTNEDGSAMSMMCVLCAGRTINPNLFDLSISTVLITHTSPGRAPV